MDEFFPAGAVIMANDPAPVITIDDMRTQAASAHTEQEIADAFAIAENKAWWVEDDMYEYELDTMEYKRARRITDDWFGVADSLRDSIITILRSEGVDIPANGQRYVLSLFMERNGYRDGNGWWVKK